MHKLLIAMVLALLLSAPGFAAEGLVTVDSPYDVATTADRLIAVLEEKGMTIVVRVNHSAAAEGAGLELDSTELVVFGNPKVGTPLMQCGRTVAIDLPQKALIWEDEEGVHLTYNDPAYLDARHGLEGCAEVLGKVSDALANFAAAAVAP